MATVSAPVKRARRLRPAPLWLSLLLAFLAYFLLDFSLRLFYGSMSNVSLWAWQPLVPKSHNRVITNCSNIIQLTVFQNNNSC